MKGERERQKEGEKQNGSEKEHKVFVSAVYFLH